jgi:multimeric flavodoxin WrbA
MTQLAFQKLGHECEIITMRELDYEGATADVNDELKPELMKIFKADGVIFATPIWWGQHSCHIQAMLERLDPIYSWAKDNNYQPMYNKVFGSLISGGGDGFQHIHGVLYSAAANFGFTIPPQCNIESKAQGLDEIVADDATLEQVKNCVTNMTVWADMLQRNNPSREARHGSVDINEAWSAKYKKSINCEEPKGFSQKAHCAGRKKKR